MQSGADERVHHRKSVQKRRKRCPLCDVDVKPESVLVAPSQGAAIRSVMLLELQHRGIVPDRKLYSIMAREYNARVVVAAQNVGKVLPKWTARDVRLHYEKCVTMVPRIETAKQYHTVNRIKNEILQRELYTVNDDGIQIVNQKALENYLKLEARATDLLKQHAVFVKNDLARIDDVAKVTEPFAVSGTAANTGEPTMFEESIQAFEV